MQENSKNDLEPRHSANLLNSTALSKDMLKKAKLLYQVNQLLKNTLPAILNEHCWLVNWTSTRATLAVDVADWLAQVRQCEQEIKNCIVSHLKLTPTIKIKYLVRPDIEKIFVNKIEKFQRSPKISVENRKILQRIANNLSDKKLQKSILKLAGE